MHSICSDLDFATSWYERDVNFDDIAKGLQLLDFKHSSTTKGIKNQSIYVYTYYTCLKLFVEHHTHSILGSFIASPKPPALNLALSPTHTRRWKYNDSSLHSMHSKAAPKYQPRLSDSEYYQVSIDLACHDPPYNTSQLPKKDSLKNALAHVLCPGPCIMKLLLPCALLICVELVPCSS
jgi:hypothetical protein